MLLISTSDLLAAEGYKYRDREPSWIKKGVWWRW